MNTGGRNLIIGLGKFIGVVVAGLAIGAALGLGLSALSGNGGSDDEEIVAGPAESATPSATAAATASPADAEAKVLKVTFEPAQSASGKARKRARLSVRAQVTNNGSGPLTVARPSIVVAAGSTESDPKADEGFAGALLKPIKAGGSATGTLRFETAGAVTTQLAAKKPATLEIAGKKLKLKR